ncbi:MAG: restriction endonuclease [Chloroflexi bacterium]|nr:restriction endonuclease [Chloroflexota bacterium]
MTPQHHDAELEARIDRLNAALKAWAKANDLWRDAQVSKVVRSFNMETGAPAVSTLRAAGRVAELVIYPGMGAIHNDPESQRLSDECDRLVEEHGFYGEPLDESCLYLLPLETHDPCFFRRLKEYMRWKWICSLVLGEFDALNSELYDYFNRNPDQLTRLHWRDFEKLVAQLMESQGFGVELGSGWGDGGVDLRLVQRDPIGDVLTLVQVKKNAAHRPIRLEAVQALYGAERAKEADRSIFVTTSRYLPGAQEFAGRQNVQMELNVSEDVRRWCEEATAGIIEEKARLVTDSELLAAFESARSDPGRVLHASGGVTMRYNRFGILLKESAASGLVVDVPTRIVEDDGYRQRGKEVPDLDDPRSVIGRRETVRRLKKSTSHSSFRFTDVNEDLDFYSTWDQQPAEFYGD